ncbi:uncharacterized protein LOC111694771 isoform X2 [Eurytemora carolleeae]|uniref:uncharacterized protein LOC111694771 isoform X2 n=1 Tax=Eurytemora carolleeae TaxID=1294199 RepID=UPI000C77FDB5|nr:uncharacterized protein LOC111694771 isoform X2 [Eurytemora carolleeae]|eukprot:XP_023319566.1 uncharacterized protein LOC111694771 isoform X2 [Eurytemora affinis]
MLQVLKYLKMKNFTINIIISIILINITAQEDLERERVGKFLNLFSVVRFTNAPCLGNTGRNGTCYTEKQCRDKDGVVSGGCGGGFGVCCVFVIGCGGTSNENTTYMTTDVSSSECSYTICKVNPTVSTIRLDFSTFEIAPPFSCGGSTEPVVCTAADGPRVGDCISDTFTVTTPGSPAPPTICGYNTGQHMYIDGNDLCNKLTFFFDLAVPASRQWEIKVTQYDSSDDSRYLPPPDCLQWHTGTLGEIKNFNFKDVNSVHLSSQRYSICWRRERNKCGMCYSVGYFGMSNIPSQVPSPSTNSWTTKAGFTDSICCDEDTPHSNCRTSGANDYIEIDNASDRPVSSPFQVGEGNRFCGRWFGISPTGLAPGYTYSAGNAARTICTSTLPFRLRVRFSDGELLGSTGCSTTRAGAGSADTSDECATFRTYGNRRGTLGFMLKWWQTNCL